MDKTISVSIPTPCAEKWNSFAPTATGGFCGSCQKNVIDFTKASDDEILAFLSRKPEHACGRFRAGQLKSYAIIPDRKIKPGFALLRAGAASLLLLLVSKPATAQARPALTEQRADKSIKQKAVDKSSPSLLTVTGTVKSAEDGTVLPGISVMQKGTITSTYTHVDGSFTLAIDPQKNTTLVFSFIGMRTIEVSVDVNNPQLVIMMQYDVLGELVITGGVCTEEVYTEPKGLKKFWNKLRNMF